MRVDGEVAVAQVGVERVAAKARHVNRQATVGRVDQRAPHVALGIEREESAAKVIGDPPRQLDARRARPRGRRL